VLRTRGQSPASPPKRIKYA